jgi:asparagine synthase (glutamine-hydrolysing)
MCGIAGFSGAFAADLAERMGATIAHRGPDGAGVWSDPDAGIGLAHRRLSIIDLSPTGSQPMADPSGGVVIVFNGEIYNFRELRAGLERSGHVFSGHSDTEVLLQLYLEKGDRLFADLNGIFAFAIWDGRRNELLLARDGLGVKPLYLAQVPEGLVFASEMKALLEVPSLGRTPDPLAIRHHLTYLWCPAPRTMLASVRKLEPGAAVWVREGRIVRTLRHYALPGGPPDEMSEDEAIESVRTALRAAVTRQMVADVPVGAFLSGGLDSSSVVAYARDVAPGRRLQCFTIGLHDGEARREGMTADLPYAEAVARHLDVDLHTVHVGPEMADSLAEMVFQLDEPQADPAPLNVLFISRLARQHGIKVLLSGAGGDDIFSGYRRHRALLFERYWAWLPQAARAALAHGAQMLPRRPALARRFAKALQYAGSEGDERLTGYFRWLDPRSVGDLLSPELRARTQDPADPLLQSLEEAPPGTNGLNRMLYLECRHFLADHNLNYTDKMSMAAGVEVRVPMLDTDLVALAARLPIAFKQRGREGKWVLKKAMEGVLPRRVIYRPKTGFGAPLRAWLHGPLRPLIEDLLSVKTLGRRGWFDPAAVARLVSEDRSGRTDAAYSIFAVACMELWARAFLDGQRPVQSDRARAR